MINIGGNIGELCVGSTPIEKAYIGSQLVWEKSSPGLPYDAELMYLESTGTQYIDTGIAPSNTLSFHVKYSNNSNNSPGYGNVFGARKASQNNEYQLSNYTTGTISIGTRNTSKLFYPQCVNDITFDGGNSVTINGVSKTVNTSAITANVGTIVLFAIRQNGSVTQQQSGRIYSCSFGNVRDFIPVRKDGVGYMYDKVSGQLFENKGSGSFVLGPDKPTISEVTTVEYLECLNAQRIDLSIIPNSSTGMRVSIIRNNATDTYAAGLRNNNQDTRWCVGQRSSGFYWGYGSAQSGGSSLPSEAILDLNYKGDGKFVIRSYTDSSEIFSNTLPSLSFTPQYPIWIGKSSGHAPVVWNGKLRSAQITQNNAVIMDLKCVRLGQTGYMYDSINDKFYCNAGTGSFTLGPDVT